MVEGIVVAGEDAVVLIEWEGGDNEGREGVLFVGDQVDNDEGVLAEGCQEGVGVIEEVYLYDDLIDMYAVDDL